MSDNVTLSPGGGGAVISTEDIGFGIELPRSKIALGAKDIDGGDVTLTNPFPVTGVAVATTTDKTQSISLTIAGTVSVSTNGCGTAYLTLTGNGTGMSFTIQGEDSNSNWNNISALTLSGSIVSAGTVLSANGQWLVPCAGFAQVRANLTTITSGTATFNWEAGSGTQAVAIINPIIGTVTNIPSGTQIVAGSGTFTVTPSGGTQTVTGSVTTIPSGTQTVIQAPTSSITTIPSGTQTVAQVTSVTTTDKTQSTSLTVAGTVSVSTNGCGTAYLTLTGNGTGMSFTIQGEDSNGNWNNITALTLAGTIVSAGTILSANGQWLVPCAGFAQVRANLTNITSGTATFNWEASSGCQAVNITNTVPVSGTLSVTPSGTQTVAYGSGTFPVSGTVTEVPSGTQTVIQAPASTVTVVQATGINLHAVLDNLPTTTDKAQSTSLTVAGTVSVPTNGCGTAYLTLTGNGTGMSFTIQGEDSAGNWNNISALTLAGAIVSAGTILSANGQWLVPCGGFAQVRANLTTITSGTATFNWEAGSGTQVVGIINTITTSPTGTQTVAYGSGTFPVSGTVTEVPSGTQTVIQAPSSTVTAVQSGTYTTAPTGTQTVAQVTSVTTTDKTQSTGLTVAGTVSVLTNGCGTAYLTLTGNGTGMSFTIQGQDGNGNWNNVSALTLAGSIVSAGTILSSNGQWLVPCGGFAQVRANLTAITSGTATFNWEAGSGTQAVAIINPIIGTVTNIPSGTQIVAGSGTFTVTPSGGTQTVTGSVTTIPSGTQTVIQAPTSSITTIPSGTQTVNVVTVATTTDKTQSTSLTVAGTVSVSTNGCGTAYLTLTGNGTGMSFTVQGEDSNGNWNNISALTLAGTIVSAGTILSSNGQWIVPCGGFQAVRANLTAITSGTATFNWEAGSGTQAVAIINPIIGTVTNIPSGTQIVAGSGTFTVTPSGGTQTVTGSVTTIPSGTQTVIQAPTSSITTIPSGTQTVNVVTVATTTDKTQSTSLTVAGTVSVSTNGCSTAYLTLTGNGTGMSFTVQGEDSNGNWNNISTLTLAGVIVSAGTVLLTNGQWIVPCGGFQAVRANLTAITSGTATFNWEAGSGTQAVAIINPITGTVTVVYGSGTFPISGTVTEVPSGTQTVIQAPGSTITTVQSGTFTITPTGTQTVVGNVASGSADSGNPVKIGGVGHTANPTAVTDGQRVDVVTDKVGRLVVVGSHVRDLVVTNAFNLTTTTETTLLSAAGAGVFQDITQLVISNDSSTAVNVIIRDTTGGTVRMTVALSRAGGTAGATSVVTIPFSPPWPQTTANSNWTIQLNVAVTTVHVFVQAVKNI